MYSPSDDDIPILIAAASGDLAKLERLQVDAGDDEGFRKRCDLIQDCEGRGPLHYASIKGKFHICKFLIEKVKVSIDVKTERGDSPLLLGLKSGRMINAKYLIVRGADIVLSDCRGITPLHYAAEKGNKELMRLLLLKGADIEAKAACGTPLQRAASLGNDVSVRFLLDHCANPNSVSPHFFSPIMCAINSNSFECFELLLKAGADPNISSVGRSPLAQAALQGKVDFIKSLLSAGANPNSIGTAFMTPIEYAAFYSKHEAVKILFPVTLCVPTFPDWSISGILNFIDSEEAKTQGQRRRDLYFRLAYARGIEAVRKKDYSDAAKWYSEAIYIDPTNAIMLSNRSLCWAHLQEAILALHDAEACVELLPNWSKAHYRGGVAWSLLKNYPMAAKAFAKALELDPENREIEEAFRNAVRYEFFDRAAKYPLEAMNIFETVNV